MGYTVLICAAFLESIPGEILDAAKLDGAGFWQCLFQVRLPLIRQGMVLSTVLVVFNGYRYFREAYLIGGKHPHERLYSLQLPAIRLAAEEAEVGHLCYGLCLIDISMKKDRIQRCISRAHQQAKNAADNPSQDVVSWF